jgi:putative phosphoesterase
MTRRTSTRIGVISDVHGDYAALQDALREFARLDVAEVLCAGDLLDWGPSPVRCIELLHERRIPCVRGNHDFLDAGGDLFDVPKFLNPKAAAFIDALPFTLSRRVAGVRVVVTHARPGDVMRGIHPDRAEVGAHLVAAAADVLVVGHTHVPMNLETPKGSIVNPGSLLRQPPGAERVPTSGTFGVIELPSRRFTVHRATDGAELGSCNAERPTNNRHRRDRVEPDPCRRCPHPRSQARTKSGRHGCELGMIALS